MEPGKHFWRAKRLQYIAGRALQKSNRFPAMSRGAEHHFRRYRRLLLAALAAWQQVPVDAHHPLEEVSA